MRLDTTLSNSRSEKEVRKLDGDKNLLIPSRKAAITASRFSVEYWRDRVFRPTYLHDKGSAEVQEWYAQLQFKGRREKIGLGTNNKEEASRRAARFFTTLRQTGWDAAHKQLSPDHAVGPKNLTTIGSYIEEVCPLLSVRPRTFEIYAYALRKIAREALGARDTSRHKYNPKSLEWRKATDLLPLSKLTPAAITKWKEKVLANAGQSPVARQRAGRNVNSFARNARALFGKKILKKLANKEIVLPTPLPFEGFEFEPQGNTKYSSTIVDASALLQNARQELADSDPEAWKVILLALGAGLRRAEIDGLCWRQVKAEVGEICVANHAYFQAKTEDSQAAIFVDPGLITELCRFRTDPDSPVIAPEIPFRQSNATQHYRGQEIFERVTSWLRAHGVKGDKPLHNLRKEFGSIICASADIYTASRQLRHSALATTAAFYADHRRRTTVAVGQMLNPPKKEDGPAGAQPSAQPESKPQAAGLAQEIHR